MLTPRLVSGVEPRFFPYLLTFLLSVFISWGILSISPVLAATLLTEINVSMGTVSGELKFVPNHLELMSGKPYKIVLNNPSPIKHYFTAKDFADVSWTQKVEAGNVEIKGAIHELELKPGAKAQWVLVPMKPGTYELHCSIAGHAEAGMIGQIVILP